MKVDDSVSKPNTKICLGIRPDIIQYATYPNNQPANYDIKAMRAAIFLNPLFISLFPVLSKKLVEYANSSRDQELYNYRVSTVSPTEYHEDLTIQKLIDKANGVQIKTINSYTGRYIDESKRPLPNYEKEFNYCVAASEIMKYYIQTNKIDKITKFYDDYVIINNGCTNPGAISFEGVYINENIIGLVNSLKGRLSENRTKPNIDYNSLMIDFFSANMGTKGVNFPNTLTDIYSNEYIAQTYFIRNLLREGLDTNKTVHLLGDNGIHLLTEGIRGYETPYAAGSPATTKTIKSWVEESYDFNKAYTENPPIATFMNAYFDREANGEDVINNFYLFYVVSNSDYTKCANQIKLISDSEGFIKTIQDYKPPA
jgi:hypothetical protein